MCLRFATVLALFVSSVHAQDIDRAVRRETNRALAFLELPQRRRAAARTLTKHGKAAVPALIRGLSHPDLRVVTSCVLVLKRLGPHGAGARAALAKLAKDPDKARAYAGAFGLDAIRDRGVIAALDSSKKKVFEYDTTGKLQRELRFDERTYDADRLPNGNYLVCFIGKGEVREIDAKNKTVWKFTGCGHPLDADRLPNGNTLIAGGKTKTVLEVDLAGKVVWQWKGTGWPNDADRLPSGNTLVTDSPAKTVYEVDPTGKVVWKYVSPNGGPIDVERLPDGTTAFVRSHGKGAAIVDDKGKVRKEHTRGYPRAIVRHIDGTTVVGGNEALLFYDAKGKIVWKKEPVGEINAVNRY